MISENAKKQLSSLIGMFLDDKSSPRVVGEAVQEGVITRSTMVNVFKVNDDIRALEYLARDIIGKEQPTSSDGRIEYLARFMVSMIRRYLAQNE